MFYDKKKYIQLYGELFNEVQSKKIFKDSKTFVDSIPQKDPQNILQEFLSDRFKNTFDLKDFVLHNFNLPEEDNIKLNLPKNRSMEEHIMMIWDFLVRKPLAIYNNYSTLIPLVDEYIVPGGRFREIYYWDSYFTMLGLYACGKYDIIKKMINNFSYLLDNFGFIPNGNRVYYLSRSQPPFYSLMINLLQKINNNKKTDSYFVSLLEKEYNFWMKSEENELLKMNKHIRVVKVSEENFLNRYFDSENIPREESFSEDSILASKVNGVSKENIYRNIRAAAESGWDFSSRWFDDGKNLSTINTTDILPLDLNCLLGYYEQFLSSLYEISKNKFKSELFRERFEVRLKLIRSKFWNEDKGYFFDYDHKEGKLKNTYSLAGMYPLFFGFAEKHQAEEAAKNLENIFLKEGGLSTTNNNTSQQWDAPNGWAPLQWISIIGLRNYEFNQTADKIKTRWLQLNESVFEQTGRMFEKYNTEDIKLYGGGGEYPLQDGFGWTNGVDLALIKNLDYEFVTGRL
ncbi:MAG: trehalase [Bacteroidetes bacterium]|nr:trehalase [Bacteroidota bacterium]